MLTSAPLVVKIGISSWELLSDLISVSVPPPPVTKQQVIFGSQIFWYCQHATMQPRVHCMHITDSFSEVNLGHDKGRQKWLNYL